MTLRHWVARLERNRARALQYVNEATYRVWRLYMAACALQFESGEIGIYQVLASKRTAGQSRPAADPASPVQLGRSAAVIHGDRCGRTAISLATASLVFFRRHEGWRSG